MSEIIKALDPLLAKLAEIEARREKIDSEMLSVLRTIAARLGVVEVIIPPAPPLTLEDLIAKLDELGRKIDTLIEETKKVIPKPAGPIRAFDKKTTTSTFATIAELTPAAGKTFHLTKIVVSCLEDVEAQLFFKDKELTVIYKIMGKLPFTDWFPFDYRTHPDLRPIIGDGTSKIELKARYPSGGTAAECYAEIIGEEV